MQDPDWLDTGDVINPAGHLAADDPGEVGLLRRVDVQLGLVGALPLILGADLQGQSVVVADVNLLTVAGRQRKHRHSTVTHFSLILLLKYKNIYLVTSSVRSSYLFTDSFRSGLQMLSSPQSNRM